MTPSSRALRARLRAYVEAHAGRVPVLGLDPEADDPAALIDHLESDGIPPRYRASTSRLFWVVAGLALVAALVVLCA